MDVVFNGGKDDHIKNDIERVDYDQRGELSNQRHEVLLIPLLPEGAAVDLGSLTWQRHCLDSYWVFLVYIRKVLMASNLFFVKRVWPGRNAALLYPS